MAEKKLFPIFYPQSRKENTTPVKKVNTKCRKPIISLDSTQMLIDAGQKKFGPITCSECGILYCVGEPDEEARHQKYHNSLHILKFSGWKNERIVHTIENDKILQIIPGDSKLWWKKITSLIEVINNDLGYNEMELDTTKYQVFLYIKSREIAGCLLAEPKDKAHRLLVINNVDFSSEESYPIKCGISRIWVSKNHRKSGIGKALVDALKLHFKFGCILNNEDIAISSPTELGKLFATKYFKTDKFLIYTC